NYLNYFVIENLDEGMAAIQLLQHNKKGKANFIIKELIPAVTPKFLESDHLVPALSVVKIDPQYEQIAQYLLQNVYIAEDVISIDISNYPEHITVVNMDG